MRIKLFSTKLRLAAVASALLLAIAVSATAVASTLDSPVQVTPGPAAQAPSAGVATPADSAHKNEPLVSAFEQLTQDYSWTLSKTIQPTWIPAGHDWEQEGFKYYDGRFYISANDYTAGDGHLIILDSNGNLIKDISYVDGLRNHSGGLSVYGDYAYIPLAVDDPASTADILQINVKTYQVKTLFTVNYDHVGGVIYDPANHLIVGQDWDSRIFYEWTLTGKLVAKWNNPTDYVGYQDCQYVAYQKMLCSGATEGNTTTGGFDLIDLSDPDHAILNGVPNVHAGNANEILDTPITGGNVLTDYDASGGPIQEYTTTVWNPGAPELSVPEGTPALDDQVDPVWDNSPVLNIVGTDSTLDPNGAQSPISAQIRLLWDDNYLYYLAQVTDPTPNCAVTSNGEPDNDGLGLDDDSIDVWINWTDSTASTYYLTSGPVASGYDIVSCGIVSTSYPSQYFGIGDPSTVKVATASTSTGYIIEAAIPWPAGVKPQPRIGIDFSVNDVSTPGGTRSSFIAWNTDTEYWAVSAGLPGVALVKSS